MLRRRVCPMKQAERHVLLNIDRKGLEQRFIDEYKGRGVYTTQNFEKGQFLLEYRGELLTQNETLHRERQYDNVRKTFLFDFQWKQKLWCIDASIEDGCLGRLVNDEWKKPNCKMKVVEVKRTPHLCLFALNNIKAGEEINYNYGDSDWPWRAKNDVPSMSEEHCGILPETTETSETSLDGRKNDVPSMSEEHCGILPEITETSETSLDGRKNDVPSMSEEHCGILPETTETSETSLDGRKNDVPSLSEEHCGILPETTETSETSLDGRKLKKYTEEQRLDLEKQRALLLQQLLQVEKKLNDGKGGSSLTNQMSSCEALNSMNLCESSSAKDNKIDSSCAEECGAPAPKILRKRLAMKSPADQLEVVSESNCSDYSDADYVPETNCSSSDESDTSESLNSSKKILLTARSRNLKKQQTEESTAAVERKTKFDSLVEIPSSQQKHHMKYKRQYCLFCGKAFIKIARHLETVHRNESEVAQAAQFSKNSRERRKRFNLLRKRGNYAHNVDVIRKGSGQMIACYRPAQSKMAKDFIHCIHCQGLYSKRTLWKHVKSCPSRPNDQSEVGRKRVRSLCAFSTPVGLEISSGLKNVLDRMTYDELTEIINKEKCILQLGEHLFRRMGSDVNKHDYIRQKMREIARLLHEARKITSLKTMEDFFVPSNFLHVVSAVKSVAGYNEEKNSYQIPSLALKLGYSLKNICSIVESNALMEGNHSLSECARNYRLVHEARWKEYISSCARITLKDAQLNMPHLLPFTQDVRLLHTFLEKKQLEIQNVLSVCPSKESYSDLCKINLSQIVLFNRRREGEVSKMPITAFTSRDKSKLHEDLAICMSEFERKLCQHFTRIEIKGKRGRKVPVLLKPKMVQALELLLETREKCGVSKENSYMFARPGGSTPYRGRDCIHKFALECGAKHPEALSSTKLRKHIATMTKVLNLEENETDQLANFLGHDIRVHREYYRLPEGTLQLAKLSKVLLAMERGSLSDFKGKKLDDIEIHPDEQILEASDDSSSSDDDLPPPGDIDEPASNSFPLEISHASHSSFPDILDQGRAAVIKRKWEKDEVNAVEKQMMKYINMCRVPGKRECVRCLEAEPQVLRNRTWTGLKYYIKNRITSLRKQSSSC